MIKAKAKKRVVSRKKQAKSTKIKPKSTKKASNKVKSKKRVINSVKPDEQPQSKNTLPSRYKKNKPRNPSGKGGWPKGVSGNPKGRVKGQNSKLDNLLISVRNVEAKLGTNLLEHFIEEAFADKTILVAAMKKLYPDLKSIEQVTLPTDLMTEKEAADIRKQMRKRFETK